MKILMWNGTLHETKQCFYRQMTNIIIVVRQKFAFASDDWQFSVVKMNLDNSIHISNNPFLNNHSCKSYTIVFFHALYKY